MLSAGLLGGPGIGFKQDYNASNSLQKADAAVYDRYKAPEESQFMGFKVVGLDGAKVGVLADNGKELGRAGELLAKAGKTDKNHEALAAWWAEASVTAEADKKLVDEAGLEGGRQALKLTSFVPLTMAGLYLLLILFFKAKGGYKPVVVEGVSGAGH
jgi:hypothetical protein